MLQTIADTMAKGMIPKPEVQSVSHVSIVPRKRAYQIDCMQQGLQVIKAGFLKPMAAQLYIIARITAWLLYLVYIVYNIII